MHFEQITPKKNKKCMFFLSPTVEMDHVAEKREVLFSGYCW